MFLFILWLYGLRLIAVISSIIWNHAPIFCNPTPNRKRVALTIDDVPWKWNCLTTSIESITQILEKENCSATCFVISSYLNSACKNVLNILKQSTKKGIIKVANHGDTNSRHATLSISKLINEIETCDKALKQHFHANAIEPYYRPGSGLFHQKMLDIAKNKGLKVILGDVYSNDPYICVPLVNLVHNVISVRNGSIIIVHDRPWTPTLLKWLLPILKWRGYEVVSVSKLLNETTN